MAYTNIIFPPNSESNPGFNRYETLLSLQQLKSKYLFGIRFVDQNGTTMDDSVFNDAILDAISQFEHEFNLTLTPTTYTQKIDYDFNDYQKYSYIQLNHRPVISLESLHIELIRNQTLVNFPDEWIRLYSESGQVQVTPTSGTISGFAVGNSGFLPLFYGVTRNFPQMIVAEYTSGFEQDKIPKFINQLIGYMASIPLLIIAGDLLYGPGIASRSINADGLSQNTSYTSTKDAGAYGARIFEYQKKIAELKAQVKNYYTGSIQLGVS